MQEQHRPCEIREPISCKYKSWLHKVHLSPHHPVMKLEVLEVFIEAIHTGLGLTSECNMPTWEHPLYLLVTLTETFEDPSIFREEETDSS